MCLIIKVQDLFKKIELSSRHRLLLLVTFNRPVLSLNLACERLQVFALCRDKQQLTAHFPFNIMMTMTMMALSM